MSEYSQVKNKISELLNSFYVGEKLTPLELDIERMYISEKL